MKSKKQKRTNAIGQNLEIDELRRNLAVRDKSIAEMSTQLILLKAARDFYKKAYEDADRKRIETEMHNKRLETDLFWRNNAIKNLQEDLKEAESKVAN